MASILKAGLPPVPRPPATLPPIRYAAAAAAAVAPQTPNPPQTPATAQPPTPNPPPTVTALSPVVTAPQSAQDQVQGAPSSPSLTHPSVTSPMLSSSASVSHQPDGSFYSGVDSPAMSEAVPSSHGAQATESPESKKGGPSLLLPPAIVEAAETASIPSPSRAEPQSPKAVVRRMFMLYYCSFLTNGQPLAALEQSTAPQANGESQTAISAPSGPSPLPQQVQQYPLSQGQPQFPPGVKVEQPQSISAVPTAQQTIGAQRVPAEQTRSSAFPGSLSDLVMSFETVKQKGAWPS
jgi:CCR4-NOT transcription complex subunit 3